MWSAVAQAQEAVPKGPSLFENLVPIFFVIIIFYFLFIRPQHRRQKLHEDFVQKLKRGDEVLTASGIFGTIEGLTEEFVTLEIADGVRIRVLRNQIASSVNKGNEK